jgi:hypothetical protein
MKRLTKNLIGRLLLLAGLLMTNVSSFAQVIRAEDLEQYSKSKYGDKWNDAAENLAKEITLDQNNCLTYVQVIDGGTQSKEQLYVLVNYWVTQQFNDANSVVQLNDKESGTIIVQGYCENIAAYTGFGATYYVNIKPTIKIDIKTGKIRVTENLQYYEVKRIDGGIAGAIAGQTNHPVTEYKYLINECYPFVAKDKHISNKKVSSKALIMSNAYENVLIDKLEKAVKNGIVGNENEDW